MTTRLSEMFSNRKVLAVIGLAVIAIGAGLLYLCASFSSMANQQKSAPAENLPVSEAMRRDIVQAIEVPAEFRPYQESDLDAKANGFVKKLFVDVGDAVRKNQILATLEVPELKDEMLRANAALSVAQNQSGKLRAQYEDDKAIYDRLAGVMKANPELIAQQEVDEAKSKSDGSYAALIAAQAAITEAQANLTRVHDMDAYTTIYAPFDGVITKRYVDEGALVGTGGNGAANALFHISEIKHLRLVAKVPEAVVPNLVVGKVASVLVSDLSRTYQLSVSRISHQLDEQTRTMHIEFDFDNADDAVAPGMYAKVQLPLTAHDQVVAVPVQAVHGLTDDGQGTVYLLDTNGTVESRQVKLGLSNPNYIEVASGIVPGEMVAVGVVPKLDSVTRYAPLKIH